MVLAFPTQAGDALQAALGVPLFQMLNEETHVHLLTDQAAMHRIDVARHPDRTAGAHSHPQVFACFQTALWQPLQQLQFLQQPFLPPGVELLEYLAQEGFNSARLSKSRLPRSIRA
jgi:hypothetical protein